jgi:[lysine-biosynthesis-protein LysW]---L-2-aminoadipate ligase
VTGELFVHRFVLVARNGTMTNQGLVGAAMALGLDAVMLPPEEAKGDFGKGDVVLGRLDVRATLDGPEPGLEALRALERAGVLVLNRAGPLLGAHDKLATALRLANVGLPHPRTAYVDADLGFDFPVVVKPRFGSWGRDVALCASRAELEDLLHGLRRKRWFRSQGALVQELVPPLGHDLRVLVAGGEVVGAVERLAAPGEWRTNVALGGRRRPITPPAQACLLALWAAHAIGADLIGVDLLPDGEGGWVVLELNGAADFTNDYRLDGEDIFVRVVRTLTHYARAAADRPAYSLADTEPPSKAASARSATGAVLA